MKRFVVVVAAVCAALFAAARTVYSSRNPEKETLDDAARKTAPGKFVRLSAGVTHYDVAGPDSARPVVLVHGFSVPLYIWDSTAAALASAGYRVIRYDEYGRGWSDRPSGDYGPDLFDKQISDLLDSLHVKEKIDLAGVSMGGWVAGTFASRHPDRVRSLILVDPVAGKTGTSLSVAGWPVVGDYVFQMAAMPTMAEGQASDFLAPQHFPDWADRYRVQMRFRGFGHSLLATRKATLGADMDTLYAHVAKTSVPVLLLWGESDRTVPFDRSNGVRAAMPAAEFHAIAGAAHLPILEKAAETDSLIIAFLGKQAR
ncbi:MAG: alpha/beta fold hydrolase [Gemmatimonadaceae bacterium]